MPKVMPHVPPILGIKAIISVLWRSKNTLCSIYFRMAVGSEPVSNPFCYRLAGVGLFLTFSTSPFGPHPAGPVRVPVWN